VKAVEWLLDSDPAIWWQAMLDLTGEPADEVAAKRAKVAVQGWGARLLALPERDGAPRREWDWLRALLLLRDMGLDPASEQALDAVAHVRDLTCQLASCPIDPSTAARPGRATGRGFCHASERTAALTR